MSDLVPLRMSEADIVKVQELEALTLQCPQVKIPTHHVLHAGVYARTIAVPAGVLLTGALIKCATILIINGDALVYLGGEPIAFVGFNVVPMGAQRKQAFVARKDTDLTMIFATNAANVEEAEGQFTDEAERLFSRQPSAVNTIDTGK